MSKLVKNIFNEEIERIKKGIEKVFHPKKDKIKTQLIPVPVRHHSGKQYKNI